MLSKYVQEYVRSSMNKVFDKELKDCSVSYEYNERMELVSAEIEMYPILDGNLISSEYVKVTFESLK